jgi:thiamine pyrophosphokinase
MGMKRCVIIGAAPNEEVAGIEMIHNEDGVICADGGLQYAVKYNITPDLVIGDFDSLENKNLLKNVPYKQLPVEKDDTDMIAAIRTAKEQGYDSCLILNGTGGRIDHTFACITALFFAESIGLKAQLYDGEMMIYALTKGKMIFSNMNGKRLSLFAFGTEKATVNGKGTYYPLDMCLIDSSFPLGVSNQIVEDEACIELISGKLLVMAENL